MARPPVTCLDVGRKDEHMRLLTPSLWQDHEGHCEVCAEDRAFLQTAERPPYETAGGRTLRVVDLFAGGGGLTLGAAEAARRVGMRTSVVLAVETDPHAADVYALNFPQANLERTDITQLVDGEPGAGLTSCEASLAERVGPVDLLIAGPPCQGHSALNNVTRHHDPRNSLYVRAARAAEVLQPALVVIENVPGVLNDHGGAVPKATMALRKAGYQVAGAVLELVRFGVPQSRRRHILLGVQGAEVSAFQALAARIPCASHPPRSLRWAIGDLANGGTPQGPWDVPSSPQPQNIERMRWLRDHDAYDLPDELRPPSHRAELYPRQYREAYGRLWWDRPAYPITTDFGSMGCGRYVHPDATRTITPHEAARIQTFPDFFQLDEAKPRSVWAKVIGNAVPPLFGLHLFEPLLRRALAGEQVGASLAWCDHA